MKAVLVSLFICALFSSQAQTELNTALSKGDVAQISAHFGNTVELSIGDHDGTLTKAEAENRLRDFYTTNVPRGFKPIHTGTSSGNDSTYNIGELTTDKRNFRVYIYFTQEGTKKQITELRFE